MSIPYEDKYLAVVCWHAMPADKRSPETLPSLMLQIGMTEDEYKQAYFSGSFATDVFDEAKRQALLEAPEIFARLMSDFRKNGNAKNIDTFTRLLDANNKKDHGPGVVLNINLPESAYESILNRELGKINQKSADTLD